MYIQSASASVNVVNSTFSGNHCANASNGCGVYLATGTLTLTNVTIANNAGAGSGLRVVVASSVLKLRNSIIAGNSGGDCTLSSGATLSENVKSIIADGSCGATAVADVKLGALTGKPAYYPLLPGSPAIDGAASAHCPDADQRGQERPQGSACDIGAFEYRPPVPITVDSGCSLVQAIISANTDASASGSSCEAGFGADTIVLTGDVTLTAQYLGTKNGLPKITTAITIEGKGYTVARSAASATPAFGLFSVASGGALILNDLTISRGLRVGGGGGIFIAAGHLTLNRSVISNNNSNAIGGGIYVFGGTVSIRDSAINNNRTGGLYIQSGSASVNVVNSTFSGNHCANLSYGCGVYLAIGTLTLTNVTIANNTGAGSGLRVLFASSVLKLRNSIIAGNSGGDCILSSGATLSENVNNIIQDGSCGATAVADVKLGALTGKPAYHPLLDGSPAIDAAASAHCPAADQRGQSRPAGSACDIGAYEFPSPAAAKTDDATKPTTTRVSSSPSLPAVNSRFGKIGSAQWRGHFARLGIQAQDAAQQANWSIGDASVTGINYCFWDYECSTDAHWAYGHYHAAHGHNYLAPGSRPPLAADRSSDGRFNLCYSVWKNGCNSPEAWEFGWASGGEIYARWHRHRAGAAVKN